VGVFSYDYGATSIDDGVILVRSAPADLVETMRGPDDAWRLMVWRGAFDNPVIRAAMSRSDWPVRLVSAMALGRDWPWRAEKGSYGPVESQSEAMTALSSSSGASGAAHRNLVLTLKIREFDDRASEVGGLAWWRSRATRLRGADAFPISLVQQIISVLDELHVLGADVFVEQLSIVLNKDGDEPLCSITPNVHTDAYAGKWGASVSSLLEDGLNPNGGAVFLPTCTMTELDPLRPISMEKLVSDFQSVPALATGTGDMFVFDGMIDRSGVSGRGNGVPHVSADAPGKGARLAILMYHAAIAATDNIDRAPSPPGRGLGSG
jgi:hypothetical protein